MAFFLILDDLEIPLGGSHFLAPTPIVSHHFVRIAIDNTGFKHPACCWNTAGTLRQHWLWSTTQIGPGPWGVIHEYPWSKQTWCAQVYWGLLAKNHHPSPSPNGEICVILGSSRLKPAFLDDVSAAGVVVGAVVVGFVYPLETPQR